MSTTRRQPIIKMMMDLVYKKKHVYGAGEGDPGTGAVVGSQVGPTASSSQDHGRSRVDRQTPGRVSAPDEAGSSRMEVAEKSPGRVTRSFQKTADGLESAFLAPAMVGDAMPSMAAGLRTRARSDDEESVASFASRSSLASTASRGKKRRIMSTFRPFSKN